MTESRKQAWELAVELFENADPVVLQKKDQTWEENGSVSDFYDRNLLLKWGSNVPGSGAPEKIMVAAVQALENRGYRVSDQGYDYLNKGLKAFAEKDYAALHQYSALLRRELLQAEKDELSDYWKYHYYADFYEYEKVISFPDAVTPDINSPVFRDQIRAGWISQLIGSAMGTMVEGYSSKKLAASFGEIYDFLREPNTYNDDITYELAFLDAFAKKGYAVTGEEIALSWVGYIPCGWSAEEAAIRNLRNGIFPPESGQVGNPFNEWIGAQMRGGICGMAAPGDLHRAAELAWKDGSISHANNGILGEVFVAVTTSLSFVEQDVRKILNTSIEMIPEDSEYRSVVDFAWNCCEHCADWHEALSFCEQKYRRYNWIHAYPNACCMVIALYYGNGDFEETLHIITMCGLDADCNAGMIMPVVAIRQGMASVPERYKHPAFGILTTYMRAQYAEIPLEQLVDMTVAAVANAVDGSKAQ